MKASESLRQQLNDAAQKEMENKAAPNETASVHYAVNSLALVEILAVLERIEEKL
jgi:hypothetical protein